MSNNLFLTIKSQAKYDGLAIKIDGTKEQINYICNVLSISKYQLKYVKKDHFIVSLLHSNNILIYSNEKEFRHAFNIVGDIENPDSGRADNETSF